MLYMTILSLGSAGNKLDKSNELKIIQIGQLEAEIFTISFLSSDQKIYTENCFFYFPYDVATN